MWSGGAIYDKQIYRIYTFEQALKYHTKKRLKKKKKRNTGAKIRQKKNGLNGLNRNNPNYLITCSHTTFIQR